jgi:hypothetical protein
MSSFCGSSSRTKMLLGASLCCACDHVEIKRRKLLSELTHDCIFRSFCQCGCVWSAAAVVDVCTEDSALVHPLRMERVHLMYQLLLLLCASGKQGFACRGSSARSFWPSAPKSIELRSYLVLKLPMLCPGCSSELAWKSGTVSCIVSTSSAVCCAVMCLSR